MKKTTLLLLLSLGLLAWASGPSVTTSAGDPASVDAIAALYVKKCAMCHGKDGVAKKMAEGSGNFNDPEWKKSTTKAEIVTITAEGKGKMPKYTGKLTAEEIEALAEYVLAMK